MTSCERRCACVRVHGVAGCTAVPFWVSDRRKTQAFLPSVLDGEAPCACPWQSAPAPANRAERRRMTGGGLRGTTVLTDGGLDGEAGRPGATVGSRWWWGMSGRRRGQRTRAMRVRLPALASRATEEGDVSAQLLARAGGKARPEKWRSDDAVFWWSRWWNHREEREEERGGAARWERGSKRLGLGLLRRGG